MNINHILADVQVLLEHVYVNPDLAVNKWSNEACNDFQIPIALILGLLIYSNDIGAAAEVTIRESLEHKAVVDIATNSQLSQVLEFNEREKCVRFRDKISLDTRNEIAKFISDNGSPGIH